MAKLIELQVCGIIVSEFIVLTSVVQCMQVQAWIPSCIIVSVMSHWYRKSLLDLYIFPEISMAQASLVTKGLHNRCVSWPEIF